MIDSTLEEAFHSMFVHPMGTIVCSLDDVREERLYCYCCRISRRKDDDESDESIRDIHFFPCILVETKMGTLENYLLAVRPWSFTASLMPILLGSALAYPSLQTVSFLALFLTCTSVLCVHAAANLFNTYVETELKD